jgi:hypothetical protein
MALLQIVQTSHGIPALYWKITNVLFNLDSSITIKVDGYIDEAARRNNYESMKVLTYTINSVDVPTEFPLGFNLADAYNYLKTQSEFSFGSVDVL